MGEHIQIIHGKADYAAAVALLEQHREELEEQIGEGNAEATIDAIRDLAIEQDEDED